MLNPEFRLLDPDPEQMDRFSSLANAPAETAVPSLPWAYALLAVDVEKRHEFLRQLTRQLATPGTHALPKIHAICKALAQKLGIPLPPIRLFGFSESLISHVLSPLTAPCVLVLGILDGEGIWAGGFAGVSGGALDFFTTFQFLWADEPELAARQSLHDLHEICQTLGNRFARPAGGLFIYRDEFIAWRQSGWSRDCLQKCIVQNTAVLHWPF